MICHKPSEEAILQKISFNQYLLQSQKEGIQVSEYIDYLSFFLCVYIYIYTYNIRWTSIDFASFHLWLEKYSKVIVSRSPVKQELTLDRVKYLQDLPLGFFTLSFFSST